VDGLAFLLPLWLFLIGCYGVATSTNFVHLVVCLSVAQSSTYVLLLQIGYQTGGTAPTFTDVPKGTRAVDPIVQALTLTDIVVGVTVMALLLALVLQAQKRTGSLNPKDLEPMSG
jgi:multicomponent Na+:H+ antiporter subunit C